MINAGEAEIVVAGGMESMTGAPHLLPGARAGFRLGDATLVDSMMFDGLTCAFDECAMGLATERYAQAAGISRERQDAFAAASHEKAAAAAKDGRLADEIVPVQIPQRKGDPLLFDTDEGVRPETTAESLGAPAAGLRQGRHHHRRQRLADLRRRGGGHRHVPGQGRGAGITPLGELVSYGQVAGPDTSLLHPAVPGHHRRPWPRPASRSADVDLFEINEAFAAVGPGLDRRAGHPRGEGQRERRGHRPRPPGRHVGHPGGPDRPLRAEAPGRRAPPRWPCAAAAARATPPCCARC